MTNEELVSIIQSRAVSAADYLGELYQKNIGIIRKMVSKYDSYAETEDLMQEAYFGLCEAVQRFEVGHDVKFMTYAEYWINLSIRRYIMNCCRTVRIPENKMWKIWEYNRFVARYYKQYGEKPPKIAIAKHLGVSRSVLYEIEKSACMVKIGSLSSPLNDEEDSTVGDMVASNEDLETDVIENLTQQRLKKELWEMVDMLEGKQPAVLRLNYQNGMTLESIGQMYNMSRNEVQGIKNKALRQLKRPKYSGRLRQYLPEQQEACAFRGNGVGSFNRTWTSSTERAALMF